MVVARFLEVTCLRAMARIVFLIFGLIYLVYGLRYPFWDEGKPGTGFFPRLISLGLISVGFISCVNLVTGLFKKHELRKLLSAHIPDMRNRISNDVLIVLLVLILYNIFVGWTGFILSTTILGFIMARLSGCKKPLISLVTGLGIAIGSYILFEKLFQTPLPSGVWLP